MKALAALILSVLLNLAATTPGFSEEPVSIGLLLPLTGGVAEQGEWLRRGARLALEQIEANDRVKLNLIYEDVAGDPRKAVTAYKRLKAQYSPPVVLSWGSGVGIALTPLVNADKTIQIGVATGSPKYSTPDDYTFRNYPSSTDEAKHSAEAAFSKLKARTVVVLQIENDYGLGAAQSFVEHFKSLGGEVAKWETFNPGAVNFRSLLTRARSLKPDLVFLATYPSEGALLVRQMRELKIDWPILATPALTGGKKFRELIGPAIEGLIILTAAPDFNNPTTEPLKKFIQSYKEHFDEYPDMGHYVALLTYDALMLLEPILEKCSSDTDCIKSELYALKDYPGIRDNISFDRYGDISARYTLQINRNGRYQTYK